MRLRRIFLWFALRSVEKQNLVAALQARHASLKQSIEAEEPQRCERQRLQAELDEQLQQSATEQKKIFDAQIAKVTQARGRGQL